MVVEYTGKKQEDMSMAISTPDYGKCRNCGVHIPRVEGRPGRKPDYCGPECRSRAQRLRDGGADAGKARTSQNLGRYIAEDLQPLSHRLLAAEYEGQPLAELLRRATQIDREVEYYVCAAVRDAKAAGASWAQIAKDAGVSIPTARQRWGEAEVERRMKRRAKERAAVGDLTMPTVRAEPGSDREQARALERAHAMLADALSHLHDRSTLTIREVAEILGLSASYVSRILSGDRLPSWEVVSSLAEVFGRAPDELAVLWELAQGQVPPTRPSLDVAVARLKAAMHGFYLAAGSPRPERIAERSGGKLSREQVRELLQGKLVPTWETTGAFVSAIDASPADIRPLWEAVHYGFMSRLDISEWNGPGPGLQET